MSKETQEQLVEILKEKAGKAAREVTENRHNTRDGPEEKKIIFNCWEQAIHEILLNQGKCSCQKEEGKCFLEFNAEDQKELALAAKQDILSFETFEGLVKKGLKKGHEKFFGMDQKPS